MAFGVWTTKSEGIGLILSVQLVSKISNLCDPDPPTLQTDRRTARRTDGRQAQDRALRYRASRGNKTNSKLNLPVRPNKKAHCDSFQIINLWSVIDINSQTNFYRAMHYIVQSAILRLPVVRPSVRLSVRPSVTLVSIFILSSDGVAVTPSVLMDFWPERLGLATYIHVPLCYGTGAPSTNICMVPLRL